MNGTDLESLQTHVLVLAPAIKDAELTRAMLSGASIACLACPDQEQLCKQLTAGAGALLVTEEALHGGHGWLSEWLGRQAPWSDLPVLFLARTGSDSAAVARAMDELGNVTIVEWPAQVATLVSAVRSALRSRRHQYNARDHLVECERLADERDRASATLKAVIERAPVGLSGVEADVRDQDANRKAADVKGHPIEAHIGQTVGESVPKLLVTLDPWSRRVMSIPQANLDSPVQAEPAKATDGGGASVVPSSPVLGLNGGPEAVGVMAEEVTEAQRIHERLQLSEQRFRLAARAVNGIIYEWDVLTGHVERTCGLYEVLGYHVAEVPPTAAWWREQIHPDDREAEEKQFAELTSDSVVVEYRVRHHDGRWLHVEDRALLLRDGGKVVKVVGCNTDVTARKRAEAKQQEAQRQIATTLESVSDGFTQLDQDWRVIYLNDAAERINQLSRVETLGKTVWEAFPILIGTRLEAEYRRSVAEQVTVELEYHHVPWDRWFVVRCYPVPKGGLVVIYRDVTHDKQTADALRRSEARFRAGIEAVSDIVWTNDARGLMAGEQVAWGNFTGQDLESYQGLGWSDAIHPDDAQPTMDAWTVAVVGQKSFAFEHRVRRRDGQWRLCTVRGAPVLDERGDISEWVGVHTDITDQVGVVAALRVSEERRRLALEAAELGTWHVDPLTGITQTDERFRAIFGTTDEWTDLSQLFSVMHPNDVQAVQTAVAAATRPDDPTPYAIEYQIIRPDGATRWVFAKGRATHEAGESGRRAVRFDGTVLDITERKRAEEALRESEARLGGILRKSPAGIIQTDAAGCMTLVNPRWCEMLGYPEEELLGRNVLEVTESSFVAPTAAAFGRLAAGGPDFQIEKAYCRKDGSMLQAQSNSAAIRSPAGQFLGMIAVIQDISERLRAAEELRRLATELSDADRRKDVFLATLGHELRNPLAPIRTGLEIMRLAGSNGKVEQARIMMDRQVSQMVRLVDDLLDVSRISQGKVELRKERVELRAVIDAAVETSRPTIEQAGHELTIMVPDEPIFVDGDAIRLSQVVSNLLNNSAKYTHRGGHIWLAAGVEGGTAVVSVKDDGIGIPVAMLERVFAMFTQVDRTLEKTTGGLGIGLSLVRGMMALHGGTIVAKSDGEGMGSEFVVRLPAVTPVASVTAELGGSNGQTGELARSTFFRILVVDDNDDSAFLLGNLLERLGNEIRTANDGEVAIEVAAEFRPDVVLMDIGMPKLNGYDAARLIRRQSWGQGIVLIALTGWGQAEDRKKSSDAGFNYHLVKPVAPNALMKLLAGLKTATIEVGSAPAS